MGSPALLRFARTKGRRASDEANAKRIRSDMCWAHNLLNEVSIDLTTSSARPPFYRLLLQSIDRPLDDPDETTLRGKLSSTTVYCTRSEQAGYTLEEYLQSCPPKQLSSDCKRGPACVQNQRSRNG